MGNDARLVKTVEILRELDYVIDLLASGYLVRAAANKLVSERGYSRKQANRYVSAALKRLQADQNLEPIESKRARVIASATKVLRDALTAKKTWVNEETGESKEYDVPDHKSALKALELLGKLEGFL